MNVLMCCMSVHCMWLVWLCACVSVRFSVSVRAQCALCVCSKFVCVYVRMCVHAYSSQRTSTLPQPPMCSCLTHWVETWWSHRDAVVIPGRSDHFNQPKGLRETSSPGNFTIIPEGHYGTWPAGPQRACDPGLSVVRSTARQPCCLLVR